MPGADIARILNAVLTRSEEKYKEHEAKTEKEKQEDIQMYRKVLLDPDTSPEQREKAAAQIDKLRGMKGKDSPFGRVAKLLNGVKAHTAPTQSAGAGGPGVTPAPPAPQATKAGGVAEGAAPQQETPQLPAAQKQVGEKLGAKIAHGLGAGLSTIDRMINPRPQSLPPIDPSVAPTAEQLRTSKAADITAEMGAREPFIEKQIKLRGEEQAKTARVRAQNAMNAKQKYPGQALINALPEDIRGKLVDANDLPVDPNGLYGPIAGEALGIENDAEGRPVLTGVRVGTGPARVGESEQIVYNTATGQFETFPIRRATDVPAPPTRVGAAGKPSLKTRTPKELPAGDVFRTAKTKQIGGRPAGIPARQFNPLQKQATAIDEARNSLVGDDPNQIGGMAADIDVFKSSESVKRLSEYIGYVNGQLEESARTGTGTGVMAAIEWYGGLPTTISNLKQEKLREYSQKLDGGAPDGPEHRFVADYYRTMGTIGGLRAATGASAAKWSFKNLQAELPTPGPVTGYEEAARRVRNFVQETNVPAKRNPMMRQTSTKNLPGGEATKKYSGPRAKMPDGQDIIVENGKWVYEKTHKPVPVQ